jgi:hypothetical protein
VEHPIVACLTLDPALGSFGLVVEACSLPEANQIRYKRAARDPQQFVPDEERDTSRSRIDAVEERKPQCAGERSKQQDLLPRIGLGSPISTCRASSRLRLTESFGSRLAASLIDLAER